MRDPRLILSSIAVAFAAMTAAAGAAEAQGRRMLVLIDASGSMTITRTDGTTRFDAAKTLARERIRTQAMAGLQSVAVFTFQNTGVTQRTAGFVAPNTALNVIEALELPDISAVTPLAGSMCDAIDALLAQGDVTTTRILQVSSDGEENATLATHPCFGPFSAINLEPFEAGSWQNKVYVKATNPGPGQSMIVRIDLFNPAPIIGFAALTRDVETGAPAVPHALALALDAQPPTLEEFFGAIARATGGELNDIDDDKPLPVVGDLDGDQCVDPADAILVVRAFGTVVPPGDGRFDFDGDGFVGFEDYVLFTAQITGTCGRPDNLVPMSPVRCTGSRNVLIQGRKIETSGTAIQVRGSCRITIRNSRIVAGGNALDIHGSAVVTVDDSVIAGVGNVAKLRGSAVLSARGTFFKGPIDLRGSWRVDDRGNNTWLP